MAKRRISGVKVVDKQLFSKRIKQAKVTLTLAGTLWAFANVFNPIAAMYDNIAPKPVNEVFLQARYGCDKEILNTIIERGDLTDGTITEVTIAAGVGFDENANFEISSDGLPPITVDYIQSSNVKVNCMISNFEAKGMKPGDSAEATHLIYTNRQKRAESIEKVCQFAKNNGISGITLDFEGQYTKDRDDYTNYVRELNNSLSEEGISLSVCIPPFTESINRVVDIKELVKICPVKVMMYNLSYREKLGPPADIRKVEKALDEISNTIEPKDKDKIIIIYNAYGVKYDSNGNRTGYIDYKDIEKRIIDNNLASKYDKVTKTKRISFGNTYIVYDDGETIKQKINLSNKKGYYSTSVWSYDKTDEEFMRSLNEASLNSYEKEVYRGLKLLGLIDNGKSSENKDSKQPEDKYNKNVVKQSIIKTVKANTGIDITFQ